MTARASLRTGRDFARVYRAGKRARVDGITVWAASSPDASASRLGLTVPGSVGGAVRRNRLRRRLREIVGSYAPAPGTDVVVRADRDVAGRNFQELQHVVSSALDRAGVGRDR